MPLVEDHPAQASVPRAVADLAREKLLDPDWLAGEIGVRAGALPGTPSVARALLIPYRDGSGGLLFERQRNPAGNEPRFLQPKGTKLHPYGLWRLADALSDASLILAEGESDTWACWAAGAPALGLPGEGNAGALEAHHLAGITKLFLAFDNPKVNGEDGTVHCRHTGGPDKAVTRALKRLAEIEYKGQVFRLRPPDGVKDLSDLRVADPAAFPARLTELIGQAEPLQLPPRWEPPPPRPPRVIRPDAGAMEKYVMAALDGACDEVAGTRDGRNNRLNTSAFEMGTLLGAVGQDPAWAGLLTREETEQRLAEAAASAGLPDREAASTIRSGLNAGMKKPRDLSKVGLRQALPAGTSRAGAAQRPGAGDGGEGGNSEPSPPPSAPAAGAASASAGQDVNEAPDDPHRLARMYLEGYRHDDGYGLRWWREEWWRWRGGVYCPVLDKELKTELGRAIKDEFDRLNREEITLWRDRGGKGKAPVAHKVTARLSADVAHALAGLVCVDSATEMPAWLAGGRDWRAGEVLSCANGLLHLPSWAEGHDLVCPPTPCLFTANSLPYSFDPGASAPASWLAFLKQVWPGDEESIRALQEWFGYSLTADTSQQKILLVVGPRRSGKGTIARLLTALVGKGNVVSPTLTQLSTNFGLQPLIGKSVAVISDARLSGRADASPVVERLLSISGEDAQTIDRKHKSPVTCKLPARFAVFTNELPTLTDTSGALAGRMVLLRMTRSWYGQEDHGLTDRLLEELPGVLLWALEGWKRLRERGRFAQPASSATLIGEMEDLSSPVGAFVRDRCEEGESYTVRMDELYEAYQKWCEVKGRKPTSQQVFGRDLRAALSHIGDSQPRIGGSRVRVYEGLRLVPITPFD